MSCKGFQRRYRPLELLRDEEVEKIHSASLNILRETGIKFESKWALEFFKKNGCFVDEISSIVKFPEGLVEECIRKAPSTFSVKAREEKNDLIISRDTVYFMDAPGMDTLDMETMTPRPPTKLEYANYVKVLDALPTVHSLGFYPYFGYEGIPPIMAIPELMAMKFKYSSKFHGCGQSNENEIFSIQMAQAVGMEILGGLAISSPLTIFNDMVTAARRYAEAGLPVITVSGSAMGATAPVTVAGDVAKTNAEIMSMLVLMQLLSPGHRFFAFEFDYPMNMTTGSLAFNDIFSTIEAAIFNQMWRHYGIPTIDHEGFMNAKIPDFQCGYEKTSGAIVAALSGTSFMEFHGGIMGELTAHPVQAVLDNDIAEMIGRLIEGEEVNDDTLALDVIKQVGPIPGHYLSTEHTKKWWQGYQYIAKAGDRTASYKEWDKGGRKTALDLAKERVEEILATHKPLPLDERKSEDIDQILSEARKYYKEKGML